MKQGITLDRPMSVGHFERKHRGRVLSEHATANQAMLMAPPHAEIWTLTDEDTVLRRIRQVDSSNYYVMKPEA